jgi:hypothetical protein
VTLAKSSGCGCNIAQGDHGFVCWRSTASQQLFLLPREQRIASALRLREAFDNLERRLAK